MKLRLHWFVTCIAVLLLAGCQNYPDRLYFKGRSAFPAAWPVIFGTIEVNQSPQFVLGHGNADIDMPPPIDDEVVLLTIPWVEYHSGTSWRADLRVPLSTLGQPHNAADLEVSIGRNGAIEILGVVAGNTAQVSLFALCATRTPDGDTAFSEAIRYHATLDNWEPPGKPVAPLPATTCTIG